MCLVWGYGKRSKTSNYLYEVNYFTISMITMNMLCIVLKTLHHHSRPYFDDKQFADPYVKDCAMEFGSPSGHTLCSV